MKVLIVLLISLVVQCVPGYSAQLQKLLGETQKLVQEPQRWTMVWWIPTEFWETTLQSNPNLTEAQRKQFSDVLDQYLILAVATMDVGPFGGLSPKSRDAIVESVTLLVDGTKRPLLGPTEISSDAANFVRLMKPMMGQMLGQFGQGMEFLLYANPPPKGKKLSASADGHFQVSAFGKEFEWKLPLPSLLPPKVDPKTKQEFPGDYRFNPFTGDELRAK